MIKPNIIDYELEFDSLNERYDTNKIVVHHTGNPTDDDLSAEEIHRIHRAQGWSGVGYHYIIRKDGTIEQGRPEWAWGAHAEQYNPYTLAVHLCGNFEIGIPTAAQIESAAYLIGYLCEKYDLVPDKDHVVGHRDLMATACPGKHLYIENPVTGESLMQTIRGKSIWYQQNCMEGD